jgi:hypothetical protein
MPNEPIAIFSARPDAGGVLAHLRNLFPDAQVESAGDTWRAVTVRFGDNGDTKAVTFLHDQDSYAGPNWPRRKAGLQNLFLPLLPAGDRKAQFRSTIDGLRFSLSTAFEPDFDPDGDERLAVVFEVAQFLDGILASPSAVRDAGGRILIGSDGGSDADAVWPTHEEMVPTPVRTPIRPGGPARPPGAKRVARRAAVLMAVVGRAVVERELRLKRASPEHAADMHDRLLRWLSELRVEVEFEPTEDALLQAAPGRLSEKHFANAMWQVEGLTVIGWALGRLDLPRYDELVSIDAVWDGLGFLESDQVKEWLTKPPLRPRDQLEPVRFQMYAYHRRLDEFCQTRQAMNFRDAITEGPSDVVPFELIDDDLALRGRRIDQAAPEIIDACQRIAAERGRAIAWLCGGSDRYSEADVGA